jgi:hypothetical protein
MATNYPGSLDAFVNPASGNTLDSPSHSLQHSDINDAVEALETKLGVGSATPGTATALFPLVAGTAGATSWTQLSATGITSGTATSGQVLTAGTATGTTIWSTPSVAGLTQIVPTSVAGGSGSGSANANGQVTFTSVSSVSLNNVFTSTYDNYLMIVNFTAISGSGVDISMKLRASGSDTSANYIYQRATRETTNTTTDLNIIGTDEFYLAYGSSTHPTTPRALVNFYNPQTNIATKINGGTNFRLSSGVFYFVDYAGVQTDTTQFDGFTIIPSSGTLSGLISVYGYRN